MKLKVCDGCQKERPIWKNIVLDGARRRLCKTCWSCHSSKTSVKKPTEAKPIAPRSKKRSKQENIYAGKCAIFKVTHTMCEAAIVGLCTHKTTDVHHIAGRSGDMLLDETEWLAVCRACHNWIETHPIEATELEFRKSK
tara:strand:- start:404 stop:820 length:417 start_codon:yes stop_codon:yes gene_type:complete